LLYSCSLYDVPDILKQSSTPISFAVLYCNRPPPSLSLPFLHSYLLPFILHFLLSSPLTAPTGHCSRCRRTGQPTEVSPTLPPLLEGNSSPTTRREGIISTCILSTTIPDRGSRLVSFRMMISAGRSPTTPSTRLPRFPCEVLQPTPIDNLPLISARSGRSMKVNSLPKPRTKR
jgi:hypothetical protein